MPPQNVIHTYSLFIQDSFIKMYVITASSVNIRKVYDRAMNMNMHTQTLTWLYWKVSVQSQFLNNVLIHFQFVGAAFMKIQKLVSKTFSEHEILGYQYMRQHICNTEYT